MERFGALCATAPAPSKLGVSVTLQRSGSFLQPSHASIMHTNGVTNKRAARFGPSTLSLWERPTATHLSRPPPADRRSWQHAQGCWPMRRAGADL